MLCLFMTALNTPHSQIIEKSSRHFTILYFLILIRYETVLHHKLTELLTTITSHMSRSDMHIELWSELANK